MMEMKLERRWRELAILLFLACLTTPFFWFTDFDLQAAALFYQPSDENDAWPWQHWWLWQILFRYADAFIRVVAIGALVIAPLGCFLPKLKPIKRPALYIFLVILLGPGLVVNLVFKDHWGRPRPVHVTEFGGQYPYIPPLEIGATGEKSFPCGHCSVSYVFFVLYFLSRKRKLFYFLLTMMLALLMGLTRMSAGGHFISDILWSGYLVFFVSWLVYYGWYNRNPI